jgi:hypothetical protein
MMSASKALSPEQDRPVTVLAMLLALVISLVLTFLVPIWASISLALATAVLVAIGGGALLAKALLVVVLVAGVWLALRHRWRRRNGRIASSMNHRVAIPEAKSKAPTAEKRITDRRAA